MVFFVNVPVGVVLVLLSPVLVAESRDAGAGRFDVAGATTITAGLVLAVYAIVNVPAVGWVKPQTLGLLVAAAVLIAVFVAIEARSAAPMVPLRVFRSRPLVGGNLALLFLGMSAYGMVFTLTAYAQQVLGYSAVQFGLMTAVMAGTAAASSFVAEAVANRGGLRSIAAISFVFVTAALLLMTGVSARGDYMDDIFWGLLVFGPGLGAGFVAGTMASMGGVEPRDAGLAAGLVNNSWQIGGSLGIAIMTSVALASTTARVSRVRHGPTTSARPPATDRACVPAASIMLLQHKEKSP